MQVEITCRHGELSPSVREYIQRKAEKLVHFFERVTAIQVTVEYEGDRVSCEILVDAEHKHNFVSRVVGDDVGPVFEQSLNKMEQQIRRYKEKIQDHRRDRPLSELSEGAANLGEPGEETGTTDSD